ncbi:MAG: conjugal transfer protein TraF [Thiohalospira sp.]
MRIRILAAATAAAVTAGGAQAASFGVYDARSVSMGNIGTSAGNPSNASFYNPALLGAPHEDTDFNLEIPMVSARAAAEDEDVIDNIDEVGDDADSLDGSINEFNDDPNGSNARLAAEDLGELSSSLQEIDDSPVEVEGFAGVLGAGTTGQWGMSVYGGARAFGGFRVDYSDGDREYFNNYSSALGEIGEFYEAVEDGESPDDLEARLEDLDDNDLVEVNVNAQDPGNSDITVDEREEMTSQGKSRGMMVGEYGISLARQFNLGGHDVSFGVTPKVLQVQTFDYTASAEDDDFSVDENTTEETGVNLDLGASKMWDNGVRTGLMVKNVAAQTYTTAEGNDLELNPQYRAGISHHTGISTVGVDLDLTENDPVAEDFDRPTQYLAVGGEFDAWNWLQLRAGYRTDLADSYEDTVHAGIGLFHIVDVGAAYSDSEVQASVRLGLRF